MSFFARPHYASDATQFIEQLKQQKPQLEAQQRAGRALLWDKDVDHRLWQQDLRPGQLRQKPYVYHSGKP